jgi:hypothetical protein
VSAVGKRGWLGRGWMLGRGGEHAAIASAWAVRSSAPTPRPSSSRGRRAHCGVCVCGVWVVGVRSMPRRDVVDTMDGRSAAHRLK